MRMPIIVAALVGAASLTACSGKSGCGESHVSLASWTRKDANFLPGASFLVPPKAVSGDIAVRTKQPGESTVGEGYNMYYHADQEYTIRSVDSSGAIENLETCKEDIGGYPAEITLVFSKASGMAGQFGSATVKLPNNRGFYLAALGETKAARDTVLAVLRSIKFPKLVDSTAK